mgnify:CR=1 FL=1
MKYKYILLGNVVAFLAVAAIATSGYDWKVSILLGVAGGIIGNYMAFDIWKRANDMLKTIIDSIGGYVGLKFEDGKVVKVSGEVNMEKLEEMLKDE